MSVYDLNHDWDNEVERLEIQHDFVRDITVGILPAPVWTHVKGLEAPKIADIGTGTGIWATELASKLPEAAVIDGYDIDVVKFPNPETLPRNVTLQFGDILKPFPPAALDKYDVVHVRFLGRALKKGEWLLAVKNLRKLLAPGGFLFWEETGPYSRTAAPWSEAFSQWLRLESEVGILLDRDTLIFATLQQSSATPVSRQPLLLAMSQSLTGLLKNRTLDGGEDVRRLVEAVRADVQNGTVLSCNIHWVWGRNMT
ncbi:S-adenosyl-L-methionine-dependent methyltransferase [Nemania abortiva]|nr:S-adenosyl-L-methionine-dependent methyltransferase [Nemania abortiva]